MMQNVPLYPHRRRIPQPVRGCAEPIGMRSVPRVACCLTHSDIPLRVLSEQIEGCAQQWEEHAKALILLSSGVGAGAKEVEMVKVRGTHVKIYRWR